MSDKENLQKVVQGWLSELNRIVANWGLIPGAPKDAFSSLGHKLIAHLTRDASEAKIVEILESELIARYGLSPTEIELEQFAAEIVNWWDKKV
jgi:hypothetical protein